jgi:cytochrome b pre-mRNA-processing protein 3
MLRWLGRALGRGDARETADRLYAAIMAAARRPALYLLLHAPDTVEGRFEMLTFHAGPVLRRLDALGKAGNAPAEDLACALADSIFRHLDVTLRQQGVGDLAVPKRMKKYAENFYGRLAAYEDAAARADIHALRVALARNALGEASRGDDAAGLAALLMATRSAMETAEFELFVSGAPPFPPVELGLASTPHAH